MTLRIFPIVSVLVPAMGTATAMPQPAAHAFAQFDQGGLVYQGTPLWPYDQVSAMAAHAAYGGNGSAASHPDQPDLLYEPVYEVDGRR